MPSGIRALDGLGRKEFKGTGPGSRHRSFRPGRTKIMHREGGMVRIYAERKSGRILGAEMVAPDGEHLAHLLAWSMQEEQTVFDLLSMPYYHPVLEETLEVALADLSEKVEGDHRPLHGFKTVDNSIFEKERR